MACTIRPARLDEGSELSNLALRSKGYWGYDEAFLDACRAELTLTTSDIESNVVIVAELDARLAGFYTITQLPHPELQHLFVEPGFIGSGVGRALFEHCVATARSIGVTRFLIESDPHAKSFYFAMGAQEVGVVASTLVVDRSLPLLAYIT